LKSTNWQPSRGAFYTDQFNNADTIRGYLTIGEELLEQTDGNITAFCGAVGTGGMLTGVARIAGC
jgi:cysteine synthase A